MTFACCSCGVSVHLSSVISALSKRSKTRGSWWQSERPESHAVVGVIYASSSLLTTSSAIVRLGSCYTQHSFDSKRKDVEILGHDSASLDREVDKQNAHSCEDFISIDKYLGSYHFFTVSPEFFCWRYPKTADSTAHPASFWPVKFFSKLNNLFFGYFDPINIFFDNKNK